MSCKICGRSSCASWMHSSEEQEQWSSLEDLSEKQLITLVIDLRGEVENLRQQIEEMKADKE